MAGDLQTEVSSATFTLHEAIFSLIHVRFLKSTVLVDDRVSISLDMHINARLYRHYQPLAHGYTKKASIFVFQLNTTRLMSRP